MDSTKDMIDLVTRAVNGDSYSFEVLYQQSYRSVYFTCISFLKNEQDALDVTQDVYMTAFQYLPTLKDRSKFMAWLIRIAVNKCKNYLNQKRTVSVDEYILENLLTEENENFLPEEYVTNQAKRQLVMDIMKNCLSDTLYQTVILYYFDCLSVTEIAEFMECPIGTVTYRLSVARAKIKEGVQQYERKNHDKLYSFAGVPFLTSLLMYEVQTMYIPYTAPSFLGISGEPAISGVANASGATNVSGTANASGATNYPGVNQGTVPNTIYNVNMAKKGVKEMFRTVRAKVAAGIVSVAVIGGAAAAIIITQRDTDNSQRKTTAEDFMADEAENIQEYEDVFTDDKTEEISTEMTETSELEETTEELTEEMPQLADNEILCNNDLWDEPCSKVTVSMPEEYKVIEKTDSFISYGSDNGNYINIYFDNVAKDYIDFQIGQGNLTSADEIINNTGSFTNDDNLEWLWIQQKRVYYSDPDYWDNTLVFVADLPTHNDRECCIVVKVYNHYNYDKEELLPEDFSNLISSSAIKIEKYE